MIKAEPLPPPTIFRMTRPMWDEMRQDAARRAPEEACGLIAGRRRGDCLEAEWLISTTNLLHSATRYRIDPQEQLAAFDRMDEQGLELVGIYHSHPNGPEELSPTDLAEAYYPETAYLVWSGQSGEWRCTAYSVQGKQVTPIRIQLVEAQN